MAKLACCLLAGLLLVLVGTGAASGRARARGRTEGRAGPPGPITLSTGWVFHPDPANVGLAAGWSRGNQGRGWEGVSLPHVFDARPLPRLFWGTSGWYRITFRVPSLPPGFSWALRFEQVRRTAQVWLNGREVGAHTDPYVPFDVPLDGARLGQLNTVVVRVDNRKGVDPREGWWNWGGITRPVHLVPEGPVVLHDLGVLSQLSCSPGEGCGPAGVLVDGWVVNRSSRPLSARVSISLRPPGSGGEPSGSGAGPSGSGAGSPGSGAGSPGSGSDQSFGGSSSALRLAPGQQARVHFTVPVPSPAQLWAPDHPNLYPALVRTSVGGTVVQKDPLDIGLRSVQVHSGLLYLNGRRIDLRGAAIQEDVPGRGPALTNGDMDTIVAQLKALHANVTRAHYLLNPGLLDRFDHAGILVWSQAPIYHRDDLLVTPAERAEALSTLSGTVLAARNHPSVLTHSVANELSPAPDQLPTTRDYLLAAARTVHALDPTVPVALDLLSYPGYPRQHTYDAFQLLGINNYFGWYAGKPPDHSTARLSDLGPYLKRMHSLYPSEAMVMTEFGAEADVNGPATEKQTYAFQSDYIQRTLGIVQSLPFMSGAIYWTLREFAVKPNWDGGSGRDDIPRNSIHHKGLISYGDQLKPAWSTAERLFAATPLYPATFPVPAAPAPAPGDILVLGGILAALGLLVGLSLWGYLGIRAAHREAEPEGVRAWRLAPSESAGQPDTTYA